MVSPTKSNLQSTKMIVITLNRLVLTWLKEASWVIGLDFVPDRAWAGVRQEALKMLESGASPTEVKRLCFTRLYKCSTGRRYAEQRNDRNWCWRIAPPPIPTRKD